MRLGVGMAVAAAAVVVASSTGASVTVPATAGLTASRFGKSAAENRPAKIVIANANGSGSRILSTGWYSFVSPDGLQVAVIDSNVNWYTNLRLELYATSGGSPRSVIDARLHGRLSGHPIRPSWPVLSLDRPAFARAWS